MKRLAIFSLLLLIVALQSQEVTSLKRLPRLYPYKVNTYKMDAEHHLYGRDPDGSPLGPERWQGNDEAEVRKEGKSSLDKRLSSLKFGYESNATTTIFRGTARKPEVVCSSPKNIPIRGCNMEEAAVATLTKRTKATTLKALQELPCFSEGTDGTKSCPYVRLRCRKGHEWKAVPGSETSFRCPTCEQASRFAMKSAAGRKKRATTPRKPKVSILESMTVHAEARGGRCLISATAKATSPLHWNSSVPFECSNGHRWTATAVNILKKASWCAQCLADERLFLMQETAAAFGGKFLGFVEDYAAMRRQLRYQVLGGTFGLEYDDFEPTTGMFKTGDGRFDAPKWPSSETVRRGGAGLKGNPGVVGDTAWLDDLVANSSGKRAKAYSQSPAYWRCANNHVFIQSSNNIRRRKGSARKCSWCPECSRSGMRFEWEETTAEKSFALKQRKTKASTKGEVGLRKQKQEQ